MNHAFLITAYKNPTQIADLINQLYSVNSWFYIHLDRKSGMEKGQILETVIHAENVTFINKNRKVYWGGFSHLNAVLLLLKEAAEDRKIDYFHTLSGQCFPVYSFEKFDLFFERNSGKEFMDCFKIDENKWTGGSMNRLQLYHLNDLFDIRKRSWSELNRRFIRMQKIFKIKRKLPESIKEYYGGGVWFSLSKNAVVFILKFVEANKGILDHFRYTHCAEELFFQSILMNSVFSENIVANDLRYVEWNTRNGSCPANLDESDFNKIIESEKLFARKIETGISCRLKQKLLANANGE